MKCFMAGFPFAIFVAASACVGCDHRDALRSVGESEHVRLALDAKRILSPAAVGRHGPKVWRVINRGMAVAAASKRAGENCPEL